MSRRCHTRLYLIEDSDSGCTKIGVSFDPFKRLLALQTANPNELTLRYMAFFKTDMSAGECESYLHNRFSERHVRGEWFRLDADEVVAEVSSDFFLPHTVEFHEVDEHSTPERVRVDIPPIYDPFIGFTDSRVAIISIVIWIITTISLFYGMLTGYTFENAIDFLGSVATYMGVTVFAMISTSLNVASDTSMRLRKIIDRALDEGGIVHSSAQERTP